MVKKICDSGKVRTAITLLGTIVAIIVGLWALSANVNASVNSAFDKHAEQVFEQKLNEFHKVVHPALMEEVDTRIEVHKLQSEIDLRKELTEIKKEQARQAGQLEEILRRLPR